MPSVVSWRPSRVPTGCARPPWPRSSTCAAHLRSSSTAAPAHRESVRSVDGVAGHSDALPQVVARSQASGCQGIGSAHQAAPVDDEESVALARQRRDTEAASSRRREVSGRGSRSTCRDPAREARHKRLSRIRQLLDDQDRSAGDLEALQRQADSADRLLLDARERLVDLRERRLAGMAAELADGLDAGDPCPVCGSCAHPTPATTSDVVTPEDIRSAEADQARATEALDLVRSKVCAELARRAARGVRARRRRPDDDGSRGALMPSRVRCRHRRGSGDGIEPARSSRRRWRPWSWRWSGCGARREQRSPPRHRRWHLRPRPRAQSKAAGAEVASLLASHGQSCPCQPSDSQLTEVAEVISHHGQTLALLRSLVTGLASSPPEPTPVTPC